MSANPDEVRSTNSLGAEETFSSTVHILSPTAEMEASIAKLPLKPEKIEKLRQQWNAARESGRARAIGTFATLIAWQEHLIRQGAGLPVDKAARTKEFLKYWQLKHPGCPISQASLYRWQEKYRKEGLPGLLPAYSTGESDHENVPEVFGDLVGKYYFHEARRPLTECYRKAKDELAVEHPVLAANLPSIATIRRYIPRHWSRQTIILYREGEEAFRRKALPFIERDRTTVAVMDVWTADHSEMDLFCVDLNGKKIRPWVTDFRDLRSNKRMGWQVHTGPSGSTVLAAFANAVRRHGVPRAVVMDNGREFTSQAFAGRSRRWKVDLDRPRVRALLTHLGTKAVITEPDNPRGKAAHERGYGIDRMFFDKWWASYCGKNPKERPSHLRYIERRKNGLPTLAEVQCAFGDHVEWNDSQSSDAQGLGGQSPDHVFASGTYEKRIPPEEDMLFLFMKTSRALTVEPNGAWLFDRFFQSERLQERLGQKIYARYDLDTIGRVYAFDLEDRYIDTVERVELLEAGATDDDVRNAKKFVKRARKLARQADEVRAQRADAPDAISFFAQRRQAVTSSATSAPSGPEKVVALKTPFGAAEKQVKARAEEREARKASRNLASAAADKQRRLRLITPHAAEPSEKELARQASAKLAWFRERQNRG